MNSVYEAGQSQLATPPINRYDVRRSNTPQMDGVGPLGRARDRVKHGNWGERSATHARHEAALLPSFSNRHVFYVTHTIELWHCSSRCD